VASDVIERTALAGESRVTRAGVSLSRAVGGGTRAEQARSVVSAPQEWPVSAMANGQNGGGRHSGPSRSRRGKWTWSISGIPV